MAYKPKGRSFRLLGIMTLFLGLAQAQVTYTYDRLGRLVSVTDSSGTTARYKYDAVGNILSITRYAAGQLAIFDLNPKRGAAGLTVTIQGIGFGDTPVQNIVKFGGVQATVESASSNKLVAKIPAGAATGDLTVQVGATTVSAGLFTIVSRYEATLSTMAAKPGEQIAMTAVDANFSDPDLQVHFNGGPPVTPTSVTATTLTVKVPVGFTDGPVTVEGPSQNFLATTPLYSMPAEASAASTAVKVVGEATVDGTIYRATSADAAGGAVLLRIPLTQGNVSLNVAPAQVGASGGFTAEVFRPSGQKIKSVFIDLANPQGIHLEPADITGAGLYSVVLQGSQSPVIDLHAVGVSDQVIPATVNTSVNFGPSKVGQHIHFPVVTEDGPLQLAFSNVAVNSNASVLTYATGPLSGSPQPLAAGTTTMAIPPWEGASTVRILTGANSTVSGTLNIRGTASDPSPVGAASTLFTAAFPQQWYRRTVTTVAGQALGVAVSDVNQPEGSNYGSVDVVTPNGFSSALYNGTYLQTLIVPDPGSGLTKVTARPMSGATSNSLRLHVGPSLPLTASPAAMTGAADAHTFAHVQVGTTDKVQVVISGLSVGTGQSRVYFQRPDNYYTYTAASTGSDLVFRADGAVASGLHAVTVDPPAGGSVTARLRIMTAEPTITDDQVATLNTAAANDTVVHNFLGAAATPRYLLLNGVTFSGATGSGKATIFPSNGSRTTLPLASGTSRMLSNLNQDGPYSVMLSAPEGGKLSGSLMISTGQALPKAAATPVNLAAGQGRVLTFAGELSTSPNVTLSGISPVPTATQPVKVVIYRPDGLAVASQTVTSASGTLNVPNITSTTAGTYVIGVFPPDNQAVSFNILQDTAAPIASAPDDQVVTFNTATSNEIFTRNFTGSTTPRYALIQGLTYTGATGNGTAALLQPNATTSSVGLPSGSSWMFGNLNQNGTYNIKITPPSGGRMSGSLLVSPGQALTKGSVTPINVTAGQGKVLTFTGAASTTPTVTLSGISPVPTATQPVRVMIYRPDGNVVASQTLTSASGTLTVPNITSATAGTYVIGVVPPTGQAVSFNIVQDTAAPVTSLADDQLLSFSTATTNEAFTRNFTGTSTPRYLILQGLTYSGATGNGTAALLSPSNTTSSVALPTGSSWMFGNLNQSGTYNVKVTPPSGGRVSGRVIESTGSPLTTGTQSSHSIAAGQGKILTFAAVSGTTPKLTFATLSPVPTTSAPVTVMVFRPDGNRVASATYTSSTYSTITLPSVTSTTAGTYVVAVFPPNGQALTFKVTRN